MQTSSSSSSSSSSSFQRGFTTPTIRDLSLSSLRNNRDQQQRQQENNNIQQRPQPPNELPTSDISCVTGEGIEKITIKPTMQSEMWRMHFVVWQDLYQFV